MKANKTKNIIIAILIVIIIGLAVGYAALAQTLTINGTVTTQATWDVEITGITASSANSSTGAKNTNNVEPTFTASTATFAVDLSHPGSTATYTIAVQNKGSINAKLQRVTDLTTTNSSAPSDLIFTITAHENDLLNSGDTTTYDVTVTWNSDSTEIQETKSKTATIELYYVQAN